MEKRYLLAERWDEWDERLTTLGCPEEKLAELKMLFFTGAETMYTLLVQALKAKDSGACIQLFNNVHDELLEYILLLEHGKN